LFYYRNARYKQSGARDAPRVLPLALALSVLFTQTSLYARQNNINDCVQHNDLKKAENIAVENGCTEKISVMQRIGIDLDLQLSGIWAHIQPVEVTVPNPA